MRFTSILVPVDFSEPSRAAMHFALDLARGLGGRVTLLHVYAQPSYAFPTPATLGVESQSRLAVAAREAVDALRLETAGSGVAIETAVAVGDPAEQIAARARRDGFDVVVMGTHGRTGLAHAVLGSVAERVVRLAPCPVLTVRRRDKSGRELRKILVATDFSEVADHALEVAAAIAEPFGAALLLLHARGLVGEPDLDALPPSMQAYADATRARLRQETRAALEELKRRSAKLSRRLRVRSELREGRAPEAISSKADSWDADLIVLGTHGRGAVGRIVLGSVATPVLRKAPCPVLIVGPPAIEAQSLETAAPYPTPS